MKLLFTLILSLVVALLQVAAQAPVTTPSLKPVAVFYNANWEVTKKEKAAYSRIAYLPERLKDIPDLHHPTFNGPIRDYFADGNLWALGSYSEGRKWGEWSFYYANGQLDCRGKFDGVWPTDKWKFWYPDGKLLMEATFDKADMYLHNFWNADGEQTIKDGTGKYTVITQDESGREMKMEGLYQNGKQAGVWTYGPLNGPVEITQDLDKSPEPAKRIFTLGNTNPFKINPVPGYLPHVENWLPDYTFYDRKYPIIADIIKSEVQRVELKNSKHATSNYYYRIVQQVNGNVDTLEHGMPIILPVFKNLAGYISGKFRFPEQLSGEKIDGLMVLGLTIRTDGSIKDVRIVRSIHPLLDKEGMRIIENMPNWKPATYKGKPIETTYSIPIRIKGAAFSIDNQFRESAGSQSSGGLMIIPSRSYY